MTRSSAFNDCRKKNYELCWISEEHKLMLDMVIYCSEGNKEEAVFKYGEDVIGE